MKKLSLLAIAALAITACENTGYKISGTATDEMEGKTVYLINVNSEEIVDSCIVTEKQILLQGEIAEPEILRMQIERKGGIVMVEPGSDITIDYTATPVKIADNGGVNDKNVTFNQEFNTYYEGIQQRYKELSEKAGKGEGDAMDIQKEINALSNEAMGTIKQMYKKTITDNKENIFGAYMLTTCARDLYDNATSLDSAITAVKYAGKMKNLEKLRTSLKQKEATQEGKPFVNFQGESIDGNKVSLSDYVGKGKYVLADFWASWCGPCRGEIPNLIEISKQFGGDNFEVLGINVWDNKQEFQKALKSEGFEYAQIFVPQDVNATELYGIQGIPQIMLFAPDGTILKRDLRGAAIKEAVEEALGK